MSSKAAADMCTVVYMDMSAAKFWKGGGKHDCWLDCSFEYR